MKIKWHHFLLTITMVGCDPLPPISTFVPTQNDAAVLTGVKYVSHTPTELVMDAELIVLNSFYSGFDNDYLEKEDFALAGAGTHIIQSFNIISQEAPADAACVLLLLDQSGSYLEQDPFNSRSQVLSKFAHDVQTPDQLLIGAATETAEDAPIEFSSDNFEIDAASASAYIYALSEKTGGASSMATAVQIAIDRLTTCDNVRKELVLFYHSGWLTAATREALIARATSENVTLHLITFGNDVAEEPSYSELATETGGLYIACPSVQEVNKVFDELARLISGQTTRYHMRIKFLPSTANTLLPASRTSHTIHITDPFSGKTYNPVVINVTIPL